MRNLRVPCDAAKSSVRRVPSKVSREKSGEWNMSMAARSGNICGCMNDKGKFAFRKGKGLQVALQKGDGVVIRKMRTGVPEPCGFPRKDSRPGVERKTVVSRQEALQQPAPKKSGPGDEELLVAEELPMAFRRVTDHFQVALG